MLNLNKSEIFSIIVVLGLVVGAFYFVSNGAKKDIQSKTAADLLKKQSSEMLIAKVSKLIELPTGETPTIATVSDLNPLKNTEFFSKASLGDQVLFYATAKKAYLYNPTLNKIVEVSVLNFSK